MADSMQAQFNTEGQPAFPVEDKEKDNSADSPTDKETKTDQTGSSDQDKDQTENKDGGADKDNLADHPRWKEREDDWTKRFNEQEKRHVDEMAKFREDLDGIKTASSKGSNDDIPADVPAWFGGDENQWKQYQEWNRSLIKEAEENALKRIAAKGDEDQKRIDAATDYFRTQVASIESDKDINPDGVKVDQNKLLKFVLDNDLVDSKGNWNYRAAWQMMQAGMKSTKSDTIDEKKKVASATTSERRGETKQPTVSTSEDFKNPQNRPW